jgi:hypothetical protein
MTHIDESGLRAMTNERISAGSAPPVIYQFRLQGHLESRRARWFNGMTLALNENGESVLTGPVADQAALFGLLKKVRDLGLPLLSVTRLDQDSPAH